MNTRAPVAILVGALTAPLLAQPCVSRWQAVGNHLDADWVAALVLHDDGAGPALYAAGGSIRPMGGWGYPFVVRLGDEKWVDLPLTLEGWPVIFTLTSFDDGSGPHLWAGGGFSVNGQHHVIRWDGTGWSPAAMGLHPGLGVNVFQVFRGSLYAGGDMSAGGSWGVARWDGAAWQGVAGGFDPPRWFGGVYAMAVYQDELYASGTFTGHAPSTEIRGIARYDGNSWRVVGTGNEIPGPGRLNALDTGPLAGLIAANYDNSLRRWDGTSWTTLPCTASGASHPWGTIGASTVIQVRGSPGILYGGTFQVWANRPSRFLAVLENDTCTPHNPGPDGNLGSIVADPARPNAAYVAGSFQTVGGIPAALVARLELCAGCYPDCNTDGALNLADFGCFQTRYALADPYADCSDDSQLTLSDFTCFQTQFALGCP